jgi:hypothetical protein
MQKPIKILKRTLFVLMIVIPVFAIAHFFIFPQQTRSILVGFSDFKKERRLYFNSNTPKNKIDSLQSLIALASQRVAAFWGQKTSDPAFIYCDDETDFKKYGSPFPVPALTHIKLGAHIVISNQGVDLDIIAHEIAHAEFYERIGFYNRTFKIPTWFDEELAMQNDYRDYYSEDTLKAKWGNYKNMPDVKKLKTGKQFNETGTHDQVMLNYMAARHEVKLSYTKEKLDKFIKDINAGKSFDEAFN